MRKYGKWLLVLGILAANPAWVSADGLLGGLRQSLPLSRNAQQQKQALNQQRAEEVARALQKAQINGYDLSVEVRGGVVKVDGKVRDVTHRARAEQACNSVEGVTEVVNNLRYVPAGQIQQTSARMVDGDLRRATYNVVDGVDTDIEQVHFTKPGKRTRTPDPEPVYQQRRQFTQRSQQQFTSQQQPQQQLPQPPQLQYATQSSAAQSAPVEESLSQSEPTEAVALPAASQQNAGSQKPVLSYVAEQKPAQQKPVAAKQQSVQQAAQAQEPTSAARPLVQTASAVPQQQVSAAANNQEVAQQIATSLGRIGLVGYDMEIRFENGIATLNGEVATVQQLQEASFAASRVPGVQDVRNQLTVQGPIAQTRFGAGPRPQGQVRPAAMSMPPMMMGGMNPGAAPTAIAGAGNYSNPNLPQHAWPAYAAYPNSAAVTYPKQYSASAWPYIGPFYPYPQVPLGWREVSLQWDDGYWQLDFEKKHNAWYWLWNPKNWD